MAKKRKVTEEVDTEAEDAEVSTKKKKRKINEVAEDEAPKAGYGKGLSAPAEIPGFELDKQLDQLERKFGIGSVGLGGKNEARMSTGMLVYDLILGGGITAGWYTNFGKEQSCKSTSSMTYVASAVNEGVPIIGYFDYEGSSEPVYIQNIMNTMGIKATVQDLFGIRDRNGKYTKKPRIRYFSADTAEPFFDWLAALERRLPNKIYEAESWWFVYDNTNDNRKRLKESGHEYDKKMFSRHNKFYVPAENGSLQAVIIVDSYPGMLPERLDEDEAGAGLGASARMFAEQLQRVKGKMRKKRIAVVGVNQLRDAPMVRHGPPEYEPGGNALKFYSDVRVQHTARAISAVGDAKKGTDTKGNDIPFESEPTVEFSSGKDIYRYISIKAIKNKLSTPYLAGFVRLWIEDGRKNARGFDPVYDTLVYLRATGQIKEKKRREKMVITLQGNEAEKPIDWLDFKRLVLGDKDTVKTICKKAGMKPFFIRKFCFKQIKSGVGLDLFVNEQSKSKGKEEDSDEEDSKDSDD